MTYYEYPGNPGEPAAPPAAPKSAITLDYLRAKADEEYAPYRIDVGDGDSLTLVNPMRLDADRRRVIQDLFSQLREIQSALEALEEDEEQPEGVTDDLHRLMVSIVAASADNPRAAKTLCDALALDFGLTQVLFTEWLGADEVGEASDSSNSSTSSETP